MKKIKRIIAIEGLIILGMGIILFWGLSILPDISFPFPKYKVEFENGENYIVTIFPGLSQHYNKKSAIEKTFNPPQQLITKRISEFIKDNNIKSTLKTAYRINSREVSFFKSIYSFFMLNFILKVVIIYVSLLIIRFIIWIILSRRLTSLARVFTGWV